jgi:hypothetical protein
MPEREDGAPYIQRCTYQKPYRGGAWQCRLTDPHEGIDHDLPVDAEFDRDLDSQDPLWLAAKLRDQVAKTRHLQKRVADLKEWGDGERRAALQDAYRAVIAGELIELPAESRKAIVDWLETRSYD